MRLYFSFEHANYCQPQTMQFSARSDSCGALHSFIRKCFFKQKLRGQGVRNSTHWHQTENTERRQNHWAWCVYSLLTLTRQSLIDLAHV